MLGDDPSHSELRDLVAGIADFAHDLVSMLADRRAGPAEAERNLPEAPERAWLLDHAVERLFQSRDQINRPVLRIVEKTVHRVFERHRVAWYARPFQLGEEIRGRAAGGDSGEVFLKERRTLVLSVVLAASAVGIGGGGAIGGWLSEWLDWRGSLIAV